MSLLFAKLPSVAFETEIIVRYRQFHDITQNLHAALVNPDTTFAGKPGDQILQSHRLLSQKP
jgi:hypothetical protein